MLQGFFQQINITDVANDLEESLIPAWCWAQICNQCKGNLSDKCLCIYCCKKEQWVCVSVNGTLQVTVPVWYNFSSIDESRRDRKMLWSLSLPCCSLILFFYFFFPLLHFEQACRYGHVQHLEHLLFYGADMTAQNASGNTALHICALYNQVLLCDSRHENKENIDEEPACQREQCWAGASSDCYYCLQA